MASGSVAAILNGTLTDAVAAQAHSGAPPTVDPVHPFVHGSLVGVLGRAPWPRDRREVRRAPWLGRSTVATPLPARPPVSRASHRPPSSRSPARGASDPSPAGALAPALSPTRFPALSPDLPPGPAPAGERDAPLAGASVSAPGEGAAPGPAFGPGAGQSALGGQVQAWFEAAVRAEVLPIVPAIAAVEQWVWSGWSAQAREAERVLLTIAARLAAVERSTEATEPATLDGEIDALLGTLGVPARPDGTRDDAAVLDAVAGVAPAMAAAVAAVLGPASRPADGVALPALSPDAVRGADDLSAAALAWIGRWSEAQAYARAASPADTSTFRWALIAALREASLRAALAADRDMTRALSDLQRGARRALDRLVAASQVRVDRSRPGVVTFHNLRDATVAPAVGAAVTVGLGPGRAEPGGAAVYNERHRLQSPDVPPPGAHARDGGRRVLAARAVTLTVRADRLLFDHGAGVEELVRSLRPSGQADVGGRPGMPDVVAHLLESPRRPFPFRGEVYVLTDAPVLAAIDRLPDLPGPLPTRD